ncbi:MAG: BatA and WFA domain-containing protein [Candidatus Riflebacteria bacterium]|nr:BatA and WFA domain-containing protein [Candidatus Riflebacteria bacterium]
MNFASPWFLLGLFGIAVPIWLHLYFKKTPVIKDFPSLRLIMKSVEYLSRQKKIRNLLLMALRIILLFLAVMALARPFIGQSAGAGVSSSAPTAFVILLDNSMSMGSTYQGVSVFNTARARALDILEQMNPSDKATVGFVNEPGGLVFPQLTWDKEALRQSISNAKLTSAGTDIASALLPALELLVPLNGYRRTIYVVTDMTESAWKPFVERYDLERIDKGIDLVMVPVGGTTPENMAVTGLETEASVVMLGRKIPLKVTVANYTNKKQTAKISISINGERRIGSEVEIEANSEKICSLDCSFSKTGMNHLEASIQNDAMPSDDQRHLAVRVFEPCKILLVKPENAGNTENNDDIFIKFALNPLNRSKENIFVVESRLTSEITNVEPSNYSAVILLNQRHLPENFIKKLSDYMLAGGNIITFLGDRVEPDWYNKHLSDNLGGGYLLPARIFKRVGNSVSKSVGYQLTDIDIGHPAFSIFGKDGNGDPSRAKIYEFFQVRPNPTAMLLCRMSHGLPGIIEEKRGRGRSLLVTFTADNKWSDWPIKPTWLPFLHQALIAMVTANDLTINGARPGMPISATITANKEEKVILKHPDGKQESIDNLTAGKGIIHFTTRNTELPGYYELIVGNKLISAFAVNPPPEESYLARINLRKIPRFIPLEQEVGKGKTVKEKVTILRDGYDMSGLAIWLLIILALVESFFANKPIEKKAPNAI